MARRGDIIDNPVTKERVVWHETTADTGGRRARFEVITGPGGGVAEHVHAVGEERFEVLAGRIAIRQDGDERLYGPGERVVVPAGTPHAWRNAGDEELRIMVELEPPGSFEPLIEATFGLARAGRVGPDGLPGPLDLAVLVRRHGLDTYPTNVPQWLLRAALPPLALVGRALGRGAVAA